MTRLLDVPWVVNEEAERISTHGGMASVDFNGAEKERREAMRLVAQAQEMAKALRPLARFVEAWDAAPMRGLDDVLYAIHGGRDAPSAKGEEIRLSELREALKVLRDAGVL